MSSAEVAGLSDAYPSYDVDLYSDEVLENPYPHYKTIRNLGAAVWLPKNKLWAISRHADVRGALFNHAVFSSAKGVAANDRTNQISAGNLLASDPPQHDLLRSIVGAPLTPKAIAGLKNQIETSADKLIERLVAQNSFDVVSDLACHLPMTIVSELVGLPEEGRQNMLKWASATFDLLGGENERAEAARPIAQEMRDYVLQVATPDRLKPGSWSARLYEAGSKGIVPTTLCPVLMRDYLGPSLDTTILATGSLIWLFGRFPKQWDLLRREPSLITNAVNEAVRLESSDPRVHPGANARPCRRVDHPSGQLARADLIRVGQS